MLASTITCPYCHKALKATKPLAVGKKVLCKQCGTTFRVSSPDISQNTPFPLKNGTATPTAIATAPVATFAGSAGALDEEPIATELDSGRIVKIALVALVLAGGFLVIGGGSVLALIYAVRKDRTQTANTKTEKPASDRSSASESLDPTAQNRRPIRPGVNDPDNRDPKKARQEEEEPVAAPRLPPEEQEKVNQALEKGLGYVKQLPQNWGQQQGHGVGHASLEGMTLLECGVAADDETVKARANYVRGMVPQLFETYDIGLAILFLDRLGDAADRAFLQTLALRLVAGQLADGGWTYRCKPLSKDEEYELLTILEQTRPRDPLELFVGPDGKVSPEYVVPRPGETLPQFVVPGDGNDLESPLKGAARQNPNEPNKAIPPAKDIAKALKDASPNIKNIPALQPPATMQLRPHGADNSNTQFAILAVWVASRYNIPMERTLALLVKRFRTSQDRQGRWGYQYGRSPGGSPGSPAMTCAGLLGLGAGYGMTAGPADKAAKRPPVQDPMVLAAFKSLESVIDKPLGKGAGKRVRQPVNLYFLWSLERVGVMYNVTNIGDKDWYHWGAELLVEHQNADGSWTNGGYPGANPNNPALTARVDTCFALLFLKRANLAKDLSKKLEYLIDVKDLGNK